MPTFRITPGLPGSGKTSGARRSGALTVNRDGIRAMLWGDPDYYQQPEELMESRECIVTIAQDALVTALLAAGHDVTADDTNLRVEHVDRWIAIAEGLAVTSLDVDTIIDGKYMSVPVSECIRRQATRADGERVSAARIIAMATDAGLEIDGEARQLAAEEAEAEALDAVPLIEQYRANLDIANLADVEVVDVDALYEASDENSVGWAIGRYHVNPPASAVKVWDGKVEHPVSLGSHLVESLPSHPLMAHLRDAAASVRVRKDVTPSFAIGDDVQPGQDRLASAIWQAVGYPDRMGNPWDPCDVHSWWVQWSGAVRCGEDGGVNLEDDTATLVTASPDGTMVAFQGRLVAALIKGTVVPSIGRELLREEVRTLDNHWFHLRLSDWGAARRG